MALINLLSGRLPAGPCVVGLGAFDGVHRGHKTLIGELQRFARGQGLPSVLFTFDHSPRCVLNSSSFLGEITTPDEKFSLLLGSGVDSVIFRPFDRDFAMTSPETFVSEIILRQLQARTVFVGFNFGFGLHRRGNATLLREILARESRDCHVLAPVKIEGRVVSSTMIREAVAEGDFPSANLLLGREFSFSGIVIHGDHRGRELGFPTANLDLESSRKVLPPRGVYLGQADTQQGTFPALVNIGVRPTFQRERLLLEAHLLDFQGNLYQETIRVRFLQRLREEVRFPSQAHLIGQIRQDLDRARAVLAGATARTS